MIPMPLGLLIQSDFDRNTDFKDTADCGCSEQVGNFYMEAVLTKPLEKLHRKLLKAGKYTVVIAAIEDLLKSPDNIDRQIDLLGSAHIEHWLPNQKRILWEILPINDLQWANRCIARVLESHNDMMALASLLGSEPLSVLRQVNQHSKTLVCIWDMLGTTSCGLGLAQQNNGLMTDYFYIGWKPSETPKRVVRIDYLPTILLSENRDELPSAAAANSQHGLRSLDADSDIVHQLKRNIWALPNTGVNKHGIWAELPYRYGKFGADYRPRLSMDETDPFADYTKEFREMLGF